MSHTCLQNRLSCANDVTRCKISAFDSYVFLITEDVEYNGSTIAVTSDHVIVRKIPNHKTNRKITSKPSVKLTIEGQRERSTRTPVKLKGDTFFISRY